ncbi:D-glucuronate isomerase [Verrucomicrobium sp. GAS474]|uniref:glucuronate isomerase n=1 Tax=Verrucomicrobium sp. GAS474 TaxID=1882831 RepID=UPI00087C746C|nr:glucuronate isomerase [Verrucomicrobium sp. GAS474]SDT88416.1 D-glucuronate isomerase [Verrucomicrobium sp. GAS474]
MKTFLTETFLLETETARELYFNEAAPQPIYDYHCHLPPKLIADNHRFRNLYEIWLGGDHYKWRAMRSNGVAERYCTGDASDREKFDAFVATVPYTLRNPLYHWSHLELERYFGIDLLIDGTSADTIWEQANAKLAEPGYAVHGLLEKCNVAVVVTTDDPADPLPDHARIAASGLKTRVYPAFRPDGAFVVDQPAAFKAWCAKLSATAQADTGTFDGFVSALKQRHDFFHAQGCRLSDHGLESCFASECSDAEAGAIFAKALGGTAATPSETQQFGTWLLLLLGRLDAAKGWTKQLHLGALRNNNSRLRARVGADAGVDSVGDFPQAAALSWYLNRLASTDELPKIVLYNLNPADNYVFATMIGNFQDGTIPGKIQFGSGWWFLDQAEGMTWQLNALSNLGLLRRFVGMLTDSRSFLSYTRHEYFRRLLCNLIGNDVAKGLLPNDGKLLGAMVREICFENARGYFGLDLDPAFAAKKG